MKKTLFPILFLLALLATACGSAAPNASGGTASGSGGPGSGPMSEVTQLAIGTMKLDDTDHPVTAQQAGELLPLWQVYQSLSSSQTAAKEEVDGLVGQIQEAMTPEQTQAIQDMNLTGQDMMTFMQEQGLSFGGQGGQNISPEQIATMQASRGTNGENGNFRPPEGGFGGGGFGGQGFQGGGGGFQGGQGTNGAASSEQIATLQAARASGRTFNNRVPSVLLDALIKFLQEKSAS